MAIVNREIILKAMVRMQKRKKIAVLGYGSQGRSAALNLRDSGYDVTIGLPPKSKSRKKARADKFSYILSVPEAVKESTTLCFAFPDHLQGKTYKSEIRANLNENSTLWFLHGFAVHFGFIKPDAHCDVILIAPHAPGLAVRDEYLGSKSLSAFYSVHQNASGRADKTVFELSRAMGFKKSKLVQTTFEDEALGDLFGEQAVLCGGLAGLIKNGFEVLVENGIPPENAYLEVAYQLDLIIALIKKYGIEGMFERISVAARFGSLEAGPEIMGESVKKKMRSRYKEIESGKFARKLNNLSPSELNSLSKNLKKLSSPLFEKMARKFSN